MEPNQNRINSIPFETYFVTNFIGDEIETLKHERILEEQLIRDFELMGNEVELVDDSNRVAPSQLASVSHYAHQAAAAAAATTTAPGRTNVDEATRTPKVLARQQSSRSGAWPTGTPSPRPAQPRVFMDVEGKQRWRFQLAAAFFFSFSLAWLAH